MHDKRETSECKIEMLYCTTFSCHSTFNETSLHNLQNGTINEGYLSAFAISIITTFYYSPKDSWTIVEFNKQAQFEHKVLFYMEKPADNTSLLALDDLEILGHKCQLPIDCDFENGHICAYSPFQSKFNWGVFTGKLLDPKIFLIS